MRLRLARRALADAKRKKTWWRRNRPDAADLFEHELDAILDDLAPLFTVKTRWRSCYTC